MDANELADRLNEVGLERDAASTYVQLLRVGPCKASEVAAAARLSRPEAYRALDLLVQRGFASSSLSRPARFEAAPTERVFQHLELEAQAHVERVREMRLLLQGPLESLRSQPVQQLERHRFNLVLGADAFARRLARLLADSKKDVRLLLAHQASQPVLDRAGGLDRLLARLPAGVNAKLLLPTDTPRPRPLAHAHHETRRATGMDLAALAIADDEQLLLVADSLPDRSLRTDGLIGIWSDAGALVRSQGALFDAAWTGAREEPPEPGAAANLMPAR